MTTEMIKIVISSTEALNQLSTLEIVRVLRKNERLQEIIDEILDILDTEGRKKLLKTLVGECLSTKELVDAVGADVIVDECSVQIEEELANINASYAEDARAIYREE